MDNPKFIKGVKFGVLILGIFGTLVTTWVTNKENEKNIEEAVNKYMAKHNNNVLNS